MNLRLAILVFSCLLFRGFDQPAAGILRAGDAVARSEAFKTQVSPFLKQHCIDCHGADESKGKFTLHELSDNFEADGAEQKWEKILRMIESGEMPPEDAEQPKEAKRIEVIRWIETRLGEHGLESSTPRSTPTTRRLTNLEYQNTMRDLLGFELNLSKNLAEDPVKPYRFHNTAEFMLIGPEQMDRYLESARRAMASAIVDPEKPAIHRTVKEWKYEANPEKLSPAEIGVYGGSGRTSVAQGMGLKSWPKTGEFRIRIKASAILSPGYNEVPFRLVMGNDLNVNSSTRQIEPLEMVRLTNKPEDAQIHEFRGRIENFPAKPGDESKGKGSSPSMHITPQNLFDNGELNDRRKSAFDTSWSMAVPRAVIESIEFEAPVADVWPPKHHTDILFVSPLRESDQPAYVREVLRRFMLRAFRRPVTSEELNRFEKIYKLLAADLPSFEAAMRETLAMVLISPQFLYHSVAQENAGLRQYELASKLSYFLWASMPDGELLALAEQAKLNDPAVIEKQVRRLLADKRSRAFVDSFATQWLGLTKLKNVSINRDLFPRFLYYVHAGERTGTEVPYRPTIRDYMHEETVGFIAELIRRNASVLKIIDSDFALLNQPLAAHYGVPDVEGLELRPVTIKPEQQLGGLLTQGSILIGNSTGSAPHPIYRAVWLREAILGEEVRPPPAEVPALTDSAGEAAEKSITIKDLLRKHRQQESCNVCHASLDPWGIPFEHYNSIGKYQPLVPKSGVKVRGFDLKTYRDYDQYAEYLKSINTVAVQADARVPRGPQIDGMNELKSYLLKERQDDIARNVLRRLLSYGLGRELASSDRHAVAQLMERTKKNDYKLADIIVAICQSETFRGLQPQEK